jgi:hypothetical protein
MSNDPISNDPQNQSPSEQPPSDQPGSDRPPFTDWRSMRHAAREARRQEIRAWRGAYGGSWRWAFGAVLVLIGLTVLVQNLTGYFFYNWWALFILIPAIGILGAAWNNYRASGRLSAYGRSALVGGILLVLLSIGLVLNLNLTIIGPIFLIVAGIAVLITALTPR